MITRFTDRLANVVSLAALLLLPSCSTFSFYSSVSDALVAEQYRADGKYIEAVAAYRRHLAQRLMSKSDDENPYFYLLLIGDCYLELGKIPQARQSYDEALTHNIANNLVAERYRRIAKWFEANNELEKAIAELSRYRELDRLLFDLEIDRLHKKFVAKEIAEQESRRSSSENQLNTAPPSSRQEPLKADGQ